MEIVPAADEKASLKAIRLIGSVSAEERVCPKEPAFRSIAVNVVVRPDPMDRFVRISIDGILVDVVNQHQGIEFEVYASDGTFIGQGRTGALDNVLAALRVYSGKKALREKADKDDVIKRVADRIADQYAAGQARDFAIRLKTDGFEIADIPDDADDPDPETLDWRDEDDPDFPVQPLSPSLF
ncbi:hypothetical protein [Sinorhizobium terangae]|uniref:hypothetical protein n=1 Tax=Sinorhizobium terangae TaxID=110322 RepID=UPI0024B14C69|nr:hypothetical protein [Sinorhizobium terangae]WFU49141.1 hypothetical protein QA637_07010 [Sinorhizobium terangae]